MNRQTFVLAKTIFVDLASDPILGRVLAEGEHPEELYIDLANEAIAAALTFEDAWQRAIERERVAADRQARSR